MKTERYQWNLQHDVAIVIITIIISIIIVLTISIPSFSLRASGSAKPGQPIYSAPPPSLLHTSQFSIPYFSLRRILLTAYSTLHTTHCLSATSHCVHCIKTTQYWFHNFRPVYIIAVNQTSTCTVGSCRPQMNGALNNQAIIKSTTLILSQMKT